MLCVAGALEVYAQSILDSTVVDPVDVQIEINRATVEMNDKPVLKSTFSEQEYKKHRQVFFIDFDMQVFLWKDSVAEETVFVQGHLSANTLRSFGYATLGYNAGPLSLAIGRGFHLVRVADNPDVQGPGGAGYINRPIWVCDVSWQSSAILLESSMQYDRSTDLLWMFGETLYAITPSVFAGCAYDPIFGGGVSARYRHERFSVGGRYLWPHERQRTKFAFSDFRYGFVRSFQIYANVTIF